ncbi:phosphoribosylglycinamide formyltransferase [Helicobacter sp. 11S03491-1]|nr:phosphoribosylglycinamide formyltransferase [Helicobacter sp. 11S03491-1]
MQNIVETLRNKVFFNNLDLENKDEIEIAFPFCITNNPNAYGISRCKELGIECKVLSHKDFSGREEFDRALLKLIAGTQVELVILSGFMRVLSPIFTSNLKSINIHPSLLPKYKGIKAIQESYQSDDNHGGVSVHWVNDVLDGGEIILQDCIPKISGESLEGFQKRIHHLEYKLYPKAILKALNLTQSNTHG